MTTLQQLQLRQSEIREKLNSLLGKEERSENENADLEKLTGEGQKLEPEIRAAIVAEPDPATTITDTGDPETREKLEIRSKTGLADCFAAAAGGREVVGAAAEYASACGMVVRFQRGKLFQITGSCGNFTVSGQRRHPTSREDLTRSRQRRSLGSKGGLRA